MYYNTLGRSGLRVSPLSLGTMTFGEDWGWGASPEESHRILARYLDAGGNFIDTANAYTKGHSEAIVGDYFEQQPAVRDRVVLATKFFSGMYQGDPNSGGTSRKSIIAQLDESLRRLKTDYIDLYWMHAWDSFTPIDETMRTLDDLVKAGKIRYVGFSDTPAWKVAQAQTMAELRDWAPLIGLQIEYSLRERTVEGELVPMARELGLGVVPWSPLSSGVLTGKYTRENVDTVTSDRGAGVTEGITENDFVIIDRLQRIADETGSTPAAVALAWLRDRPGVQSTIIGPRRMDQLDANMASLDVSLTEKQSQALTDVSEPQLPFPLPQLPGMVNFAYAGTTINGQDSVALPGLPANDTERY